MDSIKISQLPEVNPPESADQVPLVDNSGAQTGRTSINNILGLIAQSASGWNSLPYSISSVTANGNRSYSLVFSGQDLTGILSPGMRLRTERTISAPTRCTSLNGSTQYYSRSSPAGTTFTDDFVVSAWVKLTSYPSADCGIISRFNGTSGWIFALKTNGQLALQGYNAGGANASLVTSYQSIPLNKWVHITAQLDMSSFTATTTTSYVMIDGVDVPAAVTRAGTNPVALVQAGDLEIGSFNGGTNKFPGKIAQAFYTNAKVTQANVRTLMSQGLTASLISSNNIVSAYSFDNSINDLNTTTANNLSASGSAVATNADSPFGTQASGSISSTLDYGIIQAVTFSTDTTVTVQVPEGCTIPTSGGVSAVSYSAVKVPYGFPAQSRKWMISSHTRAQYAQSSAVSGTWYNVGNQQISIPAGEWTCMYSLSPAAFGTSFVNHYITLSTGSSSESDSTSTTQTYVGGSASIDSPRYKTVQISVSSQTLHYLNHKQQGGSSVNLYNIDSGTTSMIEAVNAYL